MAQPLNRWRTGSRHSKLSPAIHPPSLSEMPAEETVMQGSDCWSDAAFKRTRPNRPRRYHHHTRKTDTYYLLLPSLPSFSFRSINMRNLFSFLCMFACIHVWMYEWMFHGLIGKSSTGDFNESSSLYSSFQFLLTNAKSRFQSERGRWWKTS